MRVTCADGCCDGVEGVERAPSDRASGLLAHTSVGAHPHSALPVGKPQTQDARPGGETEKPGLIRRQPVWEGHRASRRSRREHVLKRSELPHELVERFPGVGALHPPRPTGFGKPVREPHGAGMTVESNHLRPHGRPSQLRASLHYLQAGSSIDVSDFRALLSVSARGLNREFEAVARGAERDHLARVPRAQPLEFKLHGVGEWEDSCGWVARDHRTRGASTVRHRS